MSITGNINPISGNVETYTAPISGTWSLSSGTADFITSQPTSTMDLRITGNTSTMINITLSVTDGTNTYNYTLNPRHIPFNMLNDGAVFNSGPIIDTAESGQLINIAVDSSSTATDGTWEFIVDTRLNYVKGEVETARATDVDFRVTHYGVAATVIVNYTSSVGGYGSDVFNVTQIPINLSAEPFGTAFKVYSGNLETLTAVPSNGTLGDWANVSGNRIGFNAPNYTDMTATGTNSIDVNHFLGFSFRDVIVYTNTASGGQGMVDLRTAPIPIDITVEGVPLVGNQIISGDEHNLTIDANYATTGHWRVYPITGNQQNVRFTSPGNYTDVKDDTTGLTATSTVDVFNLGPINTNYIYEYKDSVHGGLGIFQMRSISIPLVYDVNFANYSGGGDISGRLAKGSVTGTKYETGGSWSTASPSLIIIESSTSNTIDFRKVSVGNAVLNYTSYNGGQGIYAVKSNKIPITGPATLPCFVPTTYSVDAEFGGGTMTNVTANASVITTVNPTDYRLPYTRLGLSTMGYTSPDGGYGDLTVTTTYKIGNSNLDDVNPGDTGQILNPTNLTIPTNPSDPADKGTFSWTSSDPSVIRLDDTTNYAHADYTALVSGSSTISFIYTHYDNVTTLYTDNINVVAAGSNPVAINDPSVTYVNSVNGLTVDPLGNDNLNGGTFVSLDIVDLGGFPAGRISVDNTARVFNISGDANNPITPGTYNIGYTVTTNYGTSNTATSIIEVIDTIDITANDDIDIGTFNNRTTVTGVNLFANDVLNGQTITSVVLSDFSEAIGQPFDGNNVSVSTAGDFTIVPDDLSPGEYTFKYNLTTTEGATSNATVRFRTFASSTTSGGTTTFGTNGLLKEIKTVGGVTPQVLFVRPTPLTSDNIKNVYNNLTTTFGLQTSNDVNRFMDESLPVFIRAGREVYRKINSSSAAPDKIINSNGNLAQYSVVV